MSSPKIAIVIYTYHGHVAKLAEAIKEGITKAGGTATIHQIAGTNKSVANYPEFEPKKLEDYDAFLFGIPSYFGGYPHQWKTFWDSTVGLWKKSSLAGKFASLFVSTGTPGGGQEITIINSLPTLAHHGIVYVPLGYLHTVDLLSDVKEVHGGSPWGAGTFSGADDKREVSANELEIARRQGQTFWEIVSKHDFKKTP